MKVFLIVIAALVLYLEVSHAQTEDSSVDRLATTELGSASLGTGGGASDGANGPDSSNDSVNSNIADIFTNSNNPEASNTAASPNNAVDSNNEASNNAGNSDAICEACSSFDDPTSIAPKADANPCEVGECTPYYLCLNGSIITSGEGILDVRLGAEDDPMPERHPCPQYFDTCCSVKSEEPIIKAPVKKNERCGMRNKNGAGFQITNQRDNEAQFAEFPWVVAIVYRVQDFGDVVNVYKCGGSLIHPSVVMTAAHCVIDLKNVTNIVVRAGEWDTQTDGEIFPHQDRIVAEVKIHERYRPGSHFNDIALMFLEKPVDIAENVNTVCLPPQDFVFDHQRCFATGWGKNKFGKDGNYQVILKRIDLPVLPRDECQKTLRKTNLGRHFILDQSFMCAGGESGKDTCQGDGGSPFSCEILNTGSSQYYQAGMVAWGIGCFDPIPGVYVQVSKFREWVDHIFVERNLETSFYTA